MLKYAKPNPLFWSIYLPVSQPEEASRNALSLARKKSEKEIMGFFGLWAGYIEIQDTKKFGGYANFLIFRRNVVDIKKKKKREREKGKKRSENKARLIFINRM